MGTKDEEERDYWAVYDMLNKFESGLYDFQLADFRKLMKAINDRNTDLKAESDMYEAGYTDGMCNGLVVIESVYANTLFRKRQSSSVPRHKYLRFFFLRFFLKYATIFRNNNQRNII